MSNGPQYQRGAYPACEIISQALGEASTGTPQFSFRFRIPNTDDERTCYIALTEKTRDFAIEDLKRLGFSMNSLRYLDPNVAGYQDFTGTFVDMYCKHDTYNSKTSEKWSISRPLGAVDVKPLETNKMRDLDNLFGRSLKANAGPSQRPALKPQAAASLGIVDEDVPF